MSEHCFDSWMEHDFCRACCEPGCGATSGLLTALDSMCEELGVAPLSEVLADPSGYVYTPSETC